MDKFDDNYHAFELGVEIIVTAKPEFLLELYKYYVNEIKTWKMSKIDDGDFFQVEKNEQFFRELEEDEKKNDFLLEQLVCLLVYARKLILAMDSEERERTKDNMLKIREGKSEAENKIIRLVEIVAMKFRDDKIKK